jgi:hypothetical protein
MISQNYKRIAIYLFCLYKKTKMTLKKFNKAKIHLKFRKKNGGGGGGWATPNVHGVVRTIPSFNLFFS